MIPVSNHDRLRIDYAFELIRCANTVTILSLNEMEKIVLRGLSGEFDQDILLTSESKIKIPLSAVPDQGQVPHAYGLVCRWTPAHPPWWNRFHELWTWAVGKPGYNKAAWQETENAVENEIKKATRR